MTQQIAITIHEALHAYLGYDDANLYKWLSTYGGFIRNANIGSGQITDWIVGTPDHMSTAGGGCNNAGNPSNGKL